jgi:glycosyltransferase involved in cell wall biosynthesis
MSKSGQMKRILILQNIIPPYRKPVYNGLSEYYDVTVIHSGKQSVQINDNFKEIIVSSKKIGPFIFQYDILSTVRHGDYDVVIAMFDLHWINNLLSIFFAGKRTRFLLWGHRYGNNRFINKIKDFFMLVSDGIILYSDSEISKMISSHIPLSKIFIASNTVYIPNHYDGSRSVKDSFLFSGRAQKRKKVDIFLKAFAEILDQIPEHITVNIIGSGNELDNLKILIAQLHLTDRVIFHGEILDDEQLKPFFLRAYAYVSPGPVGLAVLHSFAYGVPVVTNCNERHGPEFINLVNGENALLYNSYNELKDILINLVKNKSQSEMLGERAYRLYSQERTIDKMIYGFRLAMESTI